MFGQISLNSSSNLFEVIPQEVIRNNILQRLSLRDVGILSTLSKSFYKSTVSCLLERLEKNDTLINRRLVLFDSYFKKNIFNGYIQAINYRNCNAPKFQKAFKEKFPEKNLKVELLIDSLFPFAQVIKMAFCASILKQLFQIGFTNDRVWSNAFSNVILQVVLDTLCINIYAVLACEITLIPLFFCGVALSLKKVALGTLIFYISIYILKNIL